MPNPVSGPRPDFTPAQLIATLIAGIPTFSNLLAAFHVFTLSAAQQSALTDSLTWSGVLAGLLIGGDTVVRTARNLADSRRDAAAFNAGSPPDADLTEDLDTDDATALKEDAK